MAVVGWPLRSSQLIMTLDLVLDIGSSALNEVNRIKMVSPEGPHAIPVLLGPAGGALTPDCTGSSTL